jgi:hypothetical protein
MSRKTISVEKVKSKANNLLSNPDVIMEEKLGVITMIESILHETDNYRGFMYLNLDDDGSAPKLGTDGWVSRKYF